jgi:hypothetical protein
MEQLFIRETGMTDFKFNLTRSTLSPMILGIQVQGMAFKLFLAELDGNAEELASQIHESD